MLAQPFRKIAALTLATAFALVFLASASAQPAKRAMTVEDLWKVKRLGKPALSPNGKWVAVDVTSYSMEDNDSTSELWLLSTDGKSQKQLTNRGGKVSSPAWSPDGKQIAFVLAAKDKPGQIYVLSPEGGEASQLSKLPMAASALKWCPTGRAIYCVVRTWPTTPDDESYKKKVEAEKNNKVKAYVIDDAMFRYWDTWIADGKRPVVFAVDVFTGKHKNLFAHTKLHLPVPEASANQYDIAPDGREICFVADSVKEIGSDVNLDLYTMPLDKAGAPKNITTDNDAADNQPAYSPDGKYLAFLRQKIKFFYADQNRLMVHDRKTGENRELTTKLDRSSNTPRWANPEAILFEAENNGYHHIYGATTLDNAPKKLTSGFTDTSFDYQSNTLVFMRSSFDRPVGIFVKSGMLEPKQIDHFNDALVTGWNLGKVAEVYFKGADDDEVQMWIVYPADFDAKKKWPLLQVVHGGPHNGITTDFHYRWNLQLMAARGYVVASINFHGSSGFGNKFTDSITGDMATKPFNDVMKGTDWLEKQPYIDKDRMAAAGGSYGGFMMAWLNGHTDRFKGMICHAGVYNWHSMMASDVTRSRQRPLGQPPWGDLTQIDKQSPQRFAANFKTPTLIMHGEKDYRVPVTQGFEYFSTLKLKGVPTRLIYFPDENHWILKPQNSRLWHNEFFAWLEKYVGHGPTKTSAGAPAGWYNVRGGAQ
jgi:dipeptidyl aminopeptidase/acylaminoacyl peptidase